MGNFKKMLSTPKSHLAKSGLATFLSLKCRDVIYHRNLEMETEPLLQNQEIVVAWWFHANTTFKTHSWILDLYIPTYTMVSGRSCV